MLNKLLLQRPLFLGALIRLEIPRGFQLAISFIILSLASAVFADLSEPPSIPPKIAPLKKLEDVQIARGGSVRVIVELDMSAVDTSSSTRAGDRSTPSLEEQAAQVASVQEIFLDSLTGGMFNQTGNSVETQFQYVPALVMNANKFLLTQIKLNPLVKTVLLDQAVPLALTESIPLIGADKVWQRGYKGSGQTVAIIDSGVDGTHPALAGKVVAEACFSTTYSSVGSSSLCPNGKDEQIGPGSAVPCEEITGCDHGTHVAGIATANGDVKGVAPEAKIIAIQVSSRFDNNTLCGNLPCLLIYFSDVLRALEHVLSLSNQGIVTASANLSIGGGYYSSPCDDEIPPLTEIIDNLRQLGVATVVASGNGWDGYSMSLPACISSAISVGATCDVESSDPTYDQVCPGGKDSVALFSNSADFLDLLAPGMWINSTVPGGGIGTKGGTSMSTPFITGAWALLKSAKPDATVEEILTILQDTGKPILDKRNDLTKPRIQLDAAMNALIGEEPPPPVDGPSTPPEDPPTPPENPPTPPENPPTPPEDPSLAAILPNLAVVPDEQGFHFMWEQAAELDSGGGMNLWCAKMDTDNHTFKDLTKVNQQLTAAIDEAFYPLGGISGVKYCTLEEINAAGESTFHCDAAVVISDEATVNIADLEVAKALCHSLTQ
jgi:subtilisin family serine protease